MQLYRGLNTSLGTMVTTHWGTRRDGRRESMMLETERVPVGLQSLASTGFLAGTQSFCTAKPALTKLDRVCRIDVWWVGTERLIPAFSSVASFICHTCVHTLMYQRKDHSLLFATLVLSPDSPQWTTHREHAHTPTHTLPHTRLRPPSHTQMFTQSWMPERQ